MLSGVAMILYRLLGLYSWVLMLHIILSFLPNLDNGFTRIVRGLAEPVLVPIRNLLNRYGSRGPFDWSPLLAFLVIGLVQRLLLWLV